MASERKLSEEIHSAILDLKEGGRIGESAILTIIMRLAQRLEAIESSLPGRPLDPPEG